MIQKLAKKFVSYQAACGIISREETDTYLIGYQLLINKILSISVMIAIAVAQDYLMEMMLFIVPFVFLRQYAGGLHFDSAELCIGFSAVTCIVLMPFLSVCLRSNAILSLLLELLMIFFIIRLAPIDSKNKRLEEIEYKIYRQYTRNILLVECMVYMIGVAGNIQVLWEAIEIAHIMIVTGLISGKIKNKYFALK